MVSEHLLDYIPCGIFFLLLLMMLLCYSLQVSEALIRRIAIF